MVARLRLWLFGAVAFVVAALWALLRLRTAQRDEARDRADRGQAYINTRQRIDDAPDTPSDADAARQWLRDRTGR